MRHEIRVATFVDDYDRLSGLDGRRADELRRRDADNPPLGRWLAYTGRDVIGVVTARRRPDDRIFLTFRGEHGDAQGRLAQAVIESDLRGRLAAGVAETNTTLQEALVGLGFTVETVTDDFVVPFEPVLAALARVRGPFGIRIVPVGEADRRRLFAADNELRSLVPGVDGWRGDWDWFIDELEDDAAYVVALDEETGSYVGLARVWRNDSGPRFGLIAVLPEHRRSLAGPAMLRTVLADAATWGFEAFRTWTSRSNRHTHHRLARIGAEVVASSVQLSRTV